MKKAKKRSLLGKVTALNVLLMIGVLILGVESIWGIKTLSDNSSSLYENDLKSISYLGELTTNEQRTSSLTFQILLSTNESEINRMNKEIQKIKSKK